MFSTSPRSLRPLCPLPALHATMQFMYLPATDDAAALDDALASVELVEHLRG